MKKTVIDMTSDPRRAQFALFRGYRVPYVGVSAEVDVTRLRARQRVEKPFSTRWETAKKVRKTSNSHPSAYIDTVGCELRSKSKFLRSKQ